MLVPRIDKPILDESFDLIPPIFRVFIDNYVLGDEKILFNCLKFSLKDRKESVVIRWKNSPTKNPWLEEDERLLGMIDIPELRQEIFEYNSIPTTPYSREVYHEKQSIKIGYTHGDLILLGVSEENKDCIFIYGESPFTKIADNIFDMFSKIELIPDINNLRHYGINLDKLVLDWNSNTWRVK